MTKVNADLIDVQKRLMEMNSRNQLGDELGKTS